MAKKRFLLSPSMYVSEVVWQGSTSITAKAEGGMQFWTPKGFNRFHFMGSKQFIHGGAMLQEIVVPVITVRHKKDKAVREETKTKQVTVHVLGMNHKITTSGHRFELIQMEPAKLKREFGRDLVFWGGGCDTRHILNRASPEEVEKHVLERLELFAPGGGFIFNTVHNIQADVSPERIDQVYATAIEHRNNTGRD